VSDYSEFPTTPTAWQEAQLQEAHWESVQQLQQEDPPVARRRRVDLVALIPGLFFCLVAVLLMAGADLPDTVFRNGGVVWVLLIGAGVLLLLGEVRKARTRR
jgi:hypothetical protein